MPKPVAVDAHLDALAHPARARIGFLRALITACLPGVTEGVKCNAPSYAPPGDEDRLTFRPTSLLNVQLILHRSAMAKPPLTQTSPQDWRSGCNSRTDPISSVPKYPPRSVRRFRQRYSRKYRLSLIWSQAQTTSCKRSSSRRSPPFMSG